MIQSKGIFRKWSGKWIKIGCAILLSIFVVCCGAQTTKTEPTAPLMTASPVATLDSKVVLREGLTQVLGTDNRNTPRLTEISYSTPEAGDITITWAINDNDLQDSTKITAQKDATNILKVLEDSKARFIYVVLIGTISMPDQHGQVTETQVMSLGFNKSKLDKINWEGFQSSDIYDLADVVDVVEELE